MMLKHDYGKQGRGGGGEGGKKKEKRLPYHFFPCNFYKRTNKSSKLTDF